AEETEQIRIEKEKKILEEAEKNVDRDAYDKVHHPVAALSIPNRHLDDQLEKLDQPITKNEEEQLAKEKEAERIAAVEAEAERIAVEKAAQKKKSSKLLKVE